MPESEINWGSCGGGAMDFNLDNEILWNWMIGDGICDDACNLPEYEFDFGDCCSDSITTFHCSFCFCFQDCTFHTIFEAPINQIGGFDFHDK